MNESTIPNTVSDVPWPTNSNGVRLPGALPATESASTAGGAALGRVVQGAHNAVDRLADSAAPKVKKLEERVAGAEVALRQRAAQLARTRDEWAVGLRGSVRSNPLAAVAAALALGAVIARITR